MAIQRRLLAIMFTDIVGYSALVQRDEQLRYRLLEEHRRIVRSELPRFGGREVETIGDAFLIEFASALLAVQFAITVQQRFAAGSHSHPGEERVALRIGLHLGDVERPGRKVFGHTVNIAARLQEFSPRGIALSAQVHQQVEGKLQLEYRSIGTPALKNIDQRIEVFTLDAEELIAHNASMVLSMPPQRADAAGSRKWLAAAAVVVLAVITAAGWLKYAAAPTHEASVARTEESVAVLPFASQGLAPDEAYLTTGLLDAVLTKLQHVHDLKVIARSSVEGYDQASPDYRRIAQDLGVAHVVKGSVERKGGLVKVSLQMMDPLTGRARWNQTFSSNERGDAALSGKIAQGVANELKSDITAQEQSEFEEIPTANPKAYELFQRAAAMSDVPSATDAAGQQRIAYLTRAIELDPSFLWPYKGLVYDHINAHAFGTDPDPARPEAARQLLKKMEALDPDSAWTRISRAYFYSRVLLDDRRAADEARAALLQSPGDSEAHTMLGISLQGLGQAAEAAASFERARLLDPSSISIQYNLADCYSLARQYRKSVPLLDQLIQRVPQEPAFVDARAYQALGLNGDVKTFLSTLRVLSDQPDLLEVLRLAEKISLAVVGGDFEGAQKFLRAQPAMIVSEQSYGAIPREMISANLLWVQGDAAAARALFRTHLPKLQAAATANPDDTNLHAWLALSHAVLGNENSARTEIRVVQQSAGYGSPAHRQAFSTLLAQAFLALGDRDETIHQLEQMLLQPSYANTAYVRNDQTWRTLRDDPRFQALVGSKDNPV